MDRLLQCFPLSASVRPGDVKSLIIALVIYLVACTVMGILQSVLGWIPLAGVLIRIVCWLLGIYCVAGMAVSVLQFLQS